VWSGSRHNWNRENASQNLPKIRELLLAGKNDEAEALVNQSFTCTGGGSGGGARGPWGCFQELGNLNLVWASDTKPLPLNEWKYSMIQAPEGADGRKPHQEILQLVADAVKSSTDSRSWTDYVLAGGKAVKGPANSKKTNASYSATTWN